MEMAYALHGQDWEPVIVRKRKAENVPSDEKPINRANPGGQPMGFNKQRMSQAQSISSKPAWSIENRVDNPDSTKKPLDYVDKEFVKRVIQARVAAKWKQEDLAHHACLPVAQIRELESGKAILNGIVKDKLKKVLKLQ